MTIKAVFFDMGGTIETYHYTSALRLSRLPGLRQILELAGIKLDLSDERLYQEICEGLNSYHKWSLTSLEELSPAKVWCEYIFDDVSVDSQRLRDAAEELMCYIENQFYHREIRPEIPPVLDTIQRMGLKIGLISNVNSVGQVPQNLSKYQIDRFFNPVVLSSTYGWRKPDPSIFHQAARLANVPASACIHVGDRVARDVLGARRAGFKTTVQIVHDFNHGEDDTGDPPDYVIENMYELLPILDRELSKTKFKRLPKTVIRGIIFDAGDVLYFRSGQTNPFAEFLEIHQIEFDDEKIYKQKAELKEQAYRGVVTQDEYFTALLGLYGIDQPDLLEQGKLIIQQERGDVAFFEGVQETLSELKGNGFLLGIITDTASSVHQKLNWFERGGIGHVWDSIISSKDIGVRKPDPKIYQAVLDQLGLRPEQTLFVGHKPSELEGAEAVGIKTAAFNYDSNATADYYLEQFSDLLSVPILVDPR